MRWTARSSNSSLVVVGLLGVLLTILATLQYRWIAQLSEAERTRLEAGLHENSAAFCDDFDREISGPLMFFGTRQPHDDAQLARLLAADLRQWRSESAWPGLVKRLFVIRQQDTGEPSLLCYEEVQRALQPCDWGAGLLRIRNRLRAPGTGMPIMDSALPGMVLAVDEGPRQASGSPTVLQPPRDHLVVEFDLEVITGAILPELARVYFSGPADIEYELKVSPVERPGEVVFQSGPPSSPATTRPDAANLLFALRPVAELSGPAPGIPRSGRNQDPGRILPRGNHPPGAAGVRPGRPRRNDDGRWILEVRHPAGSLESAISGARRRNMLISLATLTLLGATAVLMLLSTRRAQRLARQQMDFVAAISHDLRTPLTAIRSAGQNLADGIVNDPAKIENYGRLIEKEGRRLTEMIGRVLTFSGIRSGRDAFRLQPVDLTGIVEAALADCRWTLEEKHFDVETKIAPGIPPVNGDAGALRLVVTNLLDNAVKYGEGGRWLGVDVGVDSTRSPAEVRISVSDRGPGINRRDRKILFEPFRRGAEAAASSIPGSGLGLAVVRGVVEAHGGRLEVSSNSGSGSTFTVRLPATDAQIEQGVRI